MTQVNKKYQLSLGSMSSCPNEVKRADLREFVQCFDFSPEKLCAGLGYLLETGDDRDAPGPTTQFVNVGGDYLDKGQLKSLMGELFGDGLNPSSFVIYLEETNPDPEDVDNPQEVIAHIKVTLVHPDPLPCGGYRFLLDPLYVVPKDMRF